MLISKNAFCVRLDSEPPFSFDVFLQELTQCSNSSFLGFPFNVTMSADEPKNILYTLIPGASSARELKEQNERLADIEPNDHFYLGFSVSHAKQVIEFATNIRSDIFRAIMLSCLSFSQAFFNSLIKTEYWIYDESLVISTKEKFDEVFQEQKTLSEKLGVKMPSNHLVFEGARNRAGSSSLSFYFNRPLEIRARFSELSVAYKLHQRRKRFEKTFSFGFTSKEEIMEYNKFTVELCRFSQLITIPTDKVARDFNGNNFHKQMEKAGFSLKDSISQKRVLYVGVGMGESFAAIQKAWSNHIIVGVEPEGLCDRDRKLTNENLLFSMNAEELQDYLGGEVLFDLIIIPNINVVANEGGFWQAIAKLTAPGGEVIYGRAFVDPSMTASPTKISEYVKQNFSSLALVQLSGEKDYLDVSNELSGVTIDMQKMAVEEMIEVIRLDIPDLNVKPEDILPYLEHCTQLYYRATEPKPYVNEKPKTAFHEHMQILAEKAYSSHQCDPEVQKKNDTAKENLKTAIAEAEQRYSKGLTMLYERRQEETSEEEEPMNRGCSLS